MDVWSLILPSSIMALALAGAALALLARLRALALLLAALALTVVVLATALDVGGRLTWELERLVAPAPLPAAVDGILVLGGAVDWEESDSRGRLSLNAAAERLLAAAALAERYPEARLALTGIFRETLPRDFVARPEDESLIFGPEYAGRRVDFIGEARSTYEEGLLALERLGPRAGETWLLVTSAMHMPRALAVFETLGWRLLPYPVDYRTPAAPQWEPRLPPAAALLAFDEAVREWGALLIYRQTGRIR